MYEDVGRRECDARIRELSDRIDAGMAYMMRKLRWGKLWGVVLTLSLAVSMVVFWFDVPFCVKTSAPAVFFVAFFANELCLHKARVAQKAVARLMAEQDMLTEVE